MAATPKTVPEDRQRKNTEWPRHYNAVEERIWKEYPGASARWRGYLHVKCGEEYDRAQKAAQGGAVNP